MSTVIDTTLIYTEDVDNRDEGELALEASFQLEEEHVLISCPSRTMELKIDVDQLLEIAQALVSARDTARALYDESALG